MNAGDAVGARELWPGARPPDGSNASTSRKDCTIPMRHLTAIGAMLFVAACGGPQAPAETTAADTSEAVQLGGPASGPGTVTADLGELQPVDPATFNKVPGYSPYAGRHYPERPYFGDEHVHTSWSVDAGGSGTTLGPEEAIRFARGEEVTATSGQPVKL
jgi:hypothetical protein